MLYGRPIEAFCRRRCRQPICCFPARDVYRKEDDENRVWRRTPNARTDTSRISIAYNDRHA